MSSYSDNMERLRQIAQENGWAFNPDVRWVERVAAKMADSLDRYGDYYCPLKQVGDPPISGMDVLCPCPEADHEIAEYGHCFCRLFYAIEVGSHARVDSHYQSHTSLILS